MEEGKDDLYRIVADPPGLRSSFWVACAALAFYCVVWLICLNGWRVACVAKHMVN